MSNPSIKWSVALLFLAACSSGENTEPVPPGMGRVETMLVGASGQQGLSSKLGVKEIIVTIAKVTAHSTESGWQTLSSQTTTVDILKLAQFAKPLGFANMPKGKITQVRLYVAEAGPQYVTRDDGARVDLKVPSGLQSGIKLKGLFDVGGCQLTTLPIEFDGKHSIWVHPTGQQDEWILRPVIRAGKIEGTEVGCATPVDPTQGTNPGAGGGGGSTGSAGGAGGGIEEGPGNLGPEIGGVGSRCSTGLQCLSGECAAGTCQKGGPDAPCGTGVDCASGSCTTGTCTIGTAGGTGSSCSINAQCLSNGCVAGVCVEGSQGQPCAATSDCASGFACVSGSCAGMLN
jgi:hypothetical protein